MENDFLKPFTPKTNGPLVYNIILEKLSSNTNKFSLKYGNYFLMGIGKVEIYERIMIWLGVSNGWI